MDKNNFEAFEVWTIFNKPIARDIFLNLDKRYVEIKFPSRINAMAIDPSKISWNDGSKVYSAWEVVFSINNFLSIEIQKSDSLQITGHRKDMIMHAYLIMKNILWFNDSHYIVVHNEDEIKHVWLWSSSRLISWVMTAINELYWSPLSPNELVKLSSQNHWEESAKPGFLKHVQCIGWSAASGLYNWGLLILAGNGNVVFNTNVDPSYKLILWVPKDFQEKSAEVLMDAEALVIGDFIECWKRYWPQIAYNILHRMMPATKEWNIREVGAVIMEYRLWMWSIKNCSFCYDNLLPLFLKLKPIYDQWIASVLSVSSVWPWIFAITQNTKEVLAFFHSNNLNTSVYDINNWTYEVVSSQ